MHLNIKKTSSKPFSVTITLGLQIGYTGKMIAMEDVIKQIQEYQDNLISQKNIHLSVCISECQIVLSGQNERHLKLGFINYPKFPLRIKKLKQEIESMTINLMGSLKQNRIIIEYPDETVMLEASEEIDPAIRNLKAK